MDSVGVKSRKKRRVQQEDDETDDSTHNSKHLRKVHLDELRLCQDALLGLKRRRRLNEKLKAKRILRANLCHKIPNFWSLSFQYHPALSKLFNDFDRRVFQFLVGFELEKVEKGFLLKFLFSEYPFFHNREIIKKYYWPSKSQGQTTTTSTKLDWKERVTRVDLPIILTRERRSNGDRYTSFFSWFRNNATVFIDVVANTIRYELWINPLKSYKIFSASNQSINNSSASTESVKSDDDNDFINGENSDCDDGNDVHEAENVEVITLY